MCSYVTICALIYNYDRKLITSPTDLVSVMNVGNELYTALSRLSRQTYLMLTELPAQVIMFNTTFQIQYSPSYTGNVHGSCTIDFAYCMSFIGAFQNLIRENYNSFILTIGCITVSVYVTTNGTFKIFDSHAKDSFGMVHPQGTCVLLEVQTLNKLINRVFSGSVFNVSRYFI